MQSGGGRRLLRYGVVLGLGETYPGYYPQPPQQRSDTAYTALRAQLALGAQRR